MAVMKAVAVCPEGKELRDEPSGRITRQEYFSELTADGHQARREGVGDQHAAPRAAPLDAESLHADHHAGRCVLQVVVVVVAERTAT
ncbi:MAG: hypothetical protein ACLUNS_10445 [Alistipes shahii]